MMIDHGLMVVIFVGAFVIVTGEQNLTKPVPEIGPDRGSFLEWILGVAGLTSERPNVVEPPTNCPVCRCGLTNKGRKIVGGQETKVNEYPWVTILLYGTKFYCGGTLINNKYVLTAAHCVQGFTKDKITAKFLEHNRDSNTETKTFTRKIIRIIRHKNYSPNNYDNDIALLRLENEVPFNDVIRPVCLPPVGKSFTGLEATVVGWGALEQYGPTSDTLQEVRVPILSNEDCKKTGYGSRRITENMLCAGYPQGMKDSCQGDSGGPLHIVNNSIYSIAGIVSWGEGCAKPNYPGVYTRVNRFHSWIESNTKDACYC